MAFFLTALLSSSAWADGCRFNWEHVGDRQIFVILEQNVGQEVTDEFCPYAADYEIVIVNDAFTLGRGCIGYATAGLRKKNSDKQIVRRASNVRHSEQCNGSGDARELAATAATDAVRSIMFSLKEHIQAANELN